MAKRGTLEHPKTKRLARILGVCPGVALGLVETIFHWVGEYRKDGALTLNDLEDALDSGGWLSMFTAEAVAAAMTNEVRECVWLDVMPDGRYYVHDWHDHADDAVNRWLARAKKFFANGARPDLSRLGKDERAALTEHYERTQCAQSAPNVRTEYALPEPEPVPEPEPEPVPVPDEISLDAPVGALSAVTDAGETVVVEQIPDDPNWFELFWDTYPPRAGDRKRAESEKKFKTRVKEGADPRAIIAGAERYRAYCDATQRTKTEYVQQATTWLNNRAWLEPFEIPHDAPAKPGPSRRESPSEVYARLERDRLARVGGAA